MQIYAPVGREVGNLRKQEAAHQRPRIPESLEGSRGGRAGVVQWWSSPDRWNSESWKHWVPECGEAESSAQGTHRTKEQQRQYNSLPYLVSVHSDRENNLYILIKLNVFSLRLHKKKKCDNLAGENGSVRKGLAALVKDLSLVPTTHLVPHNFLDSTYMGSGALPGIHMYPPVHTHEYK